MPRTNSELLALELAWRWPRSYRRTEKLSDGRIAAFFEKTYQISKQPYKAKDYEVKIVFHSHKNDTKPQQYHFSEISFSDPELPVQYIDEIRQQFRTILKTWGWTEENKR